MSHVTLALGYSFGVYSDGGVSGKASVAIAKCAGFKNRMPMKNTPYPTFQASFGMFTCLGKLLSEVSCSKRLFASSQVRIKSEARFHVQSAVWNFHKFEQFFSKLF